MLYLILFLLLIAAIAGVLGTVLKAALVIVLAVILAIVILGALFYWAVKRQMRKVIDQSGPGGTTKVWTWGRPGAIDTPGRVRDEDEPPTALPG